MKCSMLAGGHLTVYVLQVFSRHAVVGGDVPVTEGCSCSGKPLILALLNACVLKGEVTKRYLWVFERLLVGHEAHGCSVKLNTPCFKV